MGRKDHGGGDAVGRPQTPDNQGIVIREGKGGFKAIVTAPV